MIKLRLTLIMFLMACFCGAPVALKAQVMEQADRHFNNNEFAQATSTDSAATWVNKPRPFEVQKVASLNSQAADFSPVKDKDGVFFSSNRSGSEQESQNDYMKMYYAKAMGNNTWAAPVALGEPINAQYHNGPAAFSEAEQTLYFTRAQVVKRGSSKTVVDPTSWLRSKDNSNSTHTNYLGIYIADRKDGAWVNLRPFKYNNTKKYSIGHPAISADGKILYFVSDMPGGFGETDIYFSERQADGSWGAPVNAGSAINTSGRESFPTIGADGNLYFSSTGHPGMGGLDIFKAVGAHKAWTMAENMQAPINSSKDDFGMMVDETGKSGLFSSARSAQATSDDIYSFSEIKPLVLKGKVTAKSDTSGAGKPIDNVLLQLSAKDGNKQEEVYTDEQGRFSFEVRPGNTYTLRSSKTGYLAQTLDIEADPRRLTDSGMIEIILDRDTPELPIRVENIYYDLDKAELRPSAIEELNKLVNVLKDNPAIRIELSSHTDSRGRTRYNQKLSERRAKNAVDYLVSQGIDRNRVTAKGYGETQLINECKDRVSCSEELHQQNRRTEFKILK